MLVYNMSLKLVQIFWGLSRLKQSFFINSQRVDGQTDGRTGAFGGEQLTDVLCYDYEQIWVIGTPFYKQTVKKSKKRKTRQFLHLAGEKGRIQKSQKMEGWYLKSVHPWNFFDKTNWCQLESKIVKKNIHDFL